jgi:hypothetical protein
MIDITFTCMPIGTLWGPCRSLWTDADLHVSAMLPPTWQAATTYCMHRKYTILSTKDSDVMPVSHPHSHPAARGHTARGPSASGNTACGNTARSHPARGLLDVFTYKIHVLHIPHCPRPSMHPAQPPPAATPHAATPPAVTPHATNPFARAPTASGPATIILSPI